MTTKLRPLAVTASASLLIVIRPSLAQTWTQTSAPITNWSSIACSADGSKLVAVAGPQFSGFTTSDGIGPIYTSRDSGVTWKMTSAPATNWTSVASSADGERLVAVAGQYSTPGPIYVSRDSGCTWTQANAPLTAWSSVATSGNGSNLVAGYFHSISNFAGGGICASADAGITWQLIDAPSPFSWDAVLSSADGGKWVAAANGWGLYTSMNSGATWALTFAPAEPFTTWGGLACSADGTKVAAARTWVSNGHGYDPGPIYTSLDSGATWTSTNAPRRNWRAVASSADGSKLVAVADSSGGIYASQDLGATWVQTSAPAAPWHGVASSADGGKLVAVVNGGGIWTAQFTVAPLLRITPSGSNLVLSWTVPSLPFALQENSDLTTTNWTDVPGTPALNLTNLQHQVTVPQPAGDRFYRLKSR